MVEIQESPPSPTARHLLHGVVGFVVIALLWGIFGKIDIVAVGEGKTVPTGRVKVIQPLESGVVKTIHVQDGQSVRKGDPLIELDVTLTGADENRLKGELELVNADIARLQALLDGVSPTFATTLTVQDRANQTDLYLQAQSQHLAEMQGFTEQLSQKRFELEGAQAAVSRLTRTLPLVTQRAQSYANLAQKNYVARNQAISMEEQRLQAAYDLKTQQAKVAELSAAVSAIRQQTENAEATFRRNTLTELNDKSQKRIGLTQELAKATERQRLQTLTAPIDGRVQELRLHTVGGVVTPAQEVLKVVPHEDALEAEVTIPNKDIGFVQEGQPVRVKFEAFPFTKYGVITGRITKLSLDAVQDEKRGLVYMARIALDKATLQVDGRSLVLTSGLAVTAKVKTGSRRIISYFLSPIMQYGDEAIRER